MAQAATYLLSHPDDVAVFSMRELARHADVPPVTLVRLAQRLGLPGYGELRKTYVDVLLGKGRRTNLATKRNIESARSILAASKSKDGLGPFVQAFIDGEEEIIRRMAAGLTLPRIAKAVDLLATAPNVFVIGRRTTFPPAFILAYALRKARPQVRLLDDVSGAPEAGLDDVQAGDVVVAFTFAPFSRVTDTLVRRAAAAKAHIVAISDSPAPPLRKFAGDLFFIAPTLSRAFPESSGGAIALANLLVALAVARLAEPAQERIRKNERFLVESGEYMVAGTRSRRRSKSQAE